MGMNGGAVYARTCADALPRLFALVAAADSRSVDNNTATENAVSAVTKIFKYNSSCIDNLDKVGRRTPTNATRLGPLPVVCCPLSV
jgi:importin-5